MGGQTRTTETFSAMPVRRIELSNTTAVWHFIVSLLNLAQRDRFSNCVRRCAMYRPGAYRQNNGDGTNSVHHGGFHAYDVRLMRLRLKTHAWAAVCGFAVPCVCCWYQANIKLRTMPRWDSRTANARCATGSIPRHPLIWWVPAERAVVIGWRASTEQVASLRLPSDISTGGITKPSNCRVEHPPKVLALVWCVCFSAFVERRVAWWNTDNTSALEQTSGYLYNAGCGHFVHILVPGELLALNEQDLLKHFSPWSVYRPLAGQHCMMRPRPRTRMTVADQVLILSSRNILTNRRFYLSC